MDENFLLPERSDLSIETLLDLAIPILRQDLTPLLLQLLGGHSPSCKGRRRERCTDEFHPDPCSPFEGLAIEPIAELVPVLTPFARHGGRLGRQARDLLVECASFLAKDINQRAEEALEADVLESGTTS